MSPSELIVYLLTPTAQIALIIGLAEIAKKMGLPTKWIPIFDLVLGLISGIVVYGIAQGQGILNGVMLGLAIGLSACGLFSGIKNTVQGFTETGGDDEDLT